MDHTALTSRIVMVASLLAATAVLAACGGGSSATSAASSAASQAASAAGGGGSSSASGGAAVSVSEGEFFIKLQGGMKLKAGSTTFDVDNGGSFPHNLTIDGPGVTDATTGDISAGSSGTVTADLKPGTYRLFCSIPGHADQGMDVQVTVS
jgi:uncharacterized cupredoxin-like copper-binding protein